MDSALTKFANVLLIFPPQCELALQGPYLSVPQLAAYLRSKGVDSDSLDLNLHFFRYLTSIRILSQQMDSLCQLRDELHQRHSLSEAELQQLLELSQLDGIRTWLDTLPGNSGLHHIDEFKRCRILLKPLLSSLPKDFEDILHFVSEDQQSTISSYYEELDLTRLCSGRSLVGFSVAFHIQLYPALELARQIKDIRRDKTMVVLGGSLLSLMTESQKGALARLSYVDAVVVHEGELPLLRICEQLSGSGVNLSKVPNTYFQMGQEVHPPKFDTPVDIGELPTPEFDVEELRLYLKPVSLPVYVSKGCYWGKCKFCETTKLYTPGQAKTPAWAVFRPAEKLVVDIESLASRYHIKSFLLISEALTPYYYRELSKKMISMCLDVEVWSYCRVEKIYDSEYFLLLYRAGVRSLTFGVEATEDRILKLINKGNTVADVRRTIRLARAAGIYVTFNVIPDYPTITWQEVERTIGFIKENVDSLTHLNNQFFALSANSLIAEEADMHGLIVDKERPIQSDQGTNCLDFSRKIGLTVEQTAQVRKMFVLLSNEIKVFQRSRDLVARINGEDFDWKLASFVLADDTETYNLHFDPAKPTEAVSGALRFERLPEQVLILACPNTKRYLSCSQPFKLILDVAKQEGCFSVNDIISHITERFGLEDAEIYRVSLVQCLKTLVEEGFIQSIFQPWTGKISKTMAEIVNLAPDSN